MEAESSDIVNIFKERSDPEIHNVTTYPIYVQQFSRGDYSVHDYYTGIQHNNPHMVLLS
jgi:hypothetical protein